MFQLPKHRSSPWHAGEKAIQQRVGVAERMEVHGQKVIRDYMPDQHREFYQQLPFIIVGAVDDQSRPWASLLEGAEGFITSPDPKSLLLETLPDNQDPAASGLQAGHAIGLLGIELHTRRRNRMNGVLREVDGGLLTVAVEHSFGNCPQYIQKRDWSRDEQRYSQRAPREDFAALNEELSAIVRNADTFFVASYVQHEDGQRSVDVSHRGGRPGFVRVEGNRLTIPDYAGNLHFNTLGNLQANPQAGLLFVDFASGDVLQVHGRSEILFDSPLLSAFEGAERLWTLDVEHAVLRRSALALRWSFREYSPTSLMTGTWTEAEAKLREREQRQHWQDWRVLRVEQESADIRSFYLQPPAGAAVNFAPGQHLPVRLVVGEQALIRTYSLSSAPSDGELRISVKTQGPASRHLHEQVGVGDHLQVRAPMGSFTLNSDSARPVVLIGAGVGITPLLSMLRELAAGPARRVHLFQSARTLGQLPFQREITELRQRTPQLQVHRALSRPEAHAVLGRDFEQVGRLDIEALKARLPLDDYDFYVCGPGEFTQAIYDGLRGLNIADARIHAETFGPSTLKRRGDSQAPALVQPPAATEPVPVYFAGSAKEARWKPDSGSLLELAEARGLSPDFSCRGGSCGTCRTKIVSGQVHYPNPPAELPEAGSALICCAIPAQDENGVQPLVLDL
ncbi:pyridoxamine 5'-phosphate oxidase family protein [Pseudomonas nitroreducens]|uniref:pyridoxamine 5'-phosphate oxidase family protein n=1 Tax=Pseudomonas nitroreducens TaxID=46680 RepID=UPI00265A7DAD|nr:pyridoxamine 5'-phosphate oxidase family protein [Pseudomonas nitroreducens]MCP1648080.1 ferredoxin-NADP reductase/predicted pyridoxine 5'-phosphate oxidase superfamily flavin-nucleotide-binding protein [Pseudomonas nitroreducens]MCP1686656.1 ferredoxin-NADP reductase/predicted pyridoxine 5'-phosphate oxidase superfamily flavin-nucleotide-binding protein [Pseudomonas nitroreducens]